MPNYWPDDHPPVAVEVVGWLVTGVVTLAVLAVTWGMVFAVWVGLRAMWRFAT